uniref:SAM domain-containing protein n=2 Tax=Kalanchoe fedtschenkoi TaxID=63787 RepID=A0A7N0T1F9_KALFE
MYWFVEMLTMSMNSKRERRPNVRLEEIGDLPAAVSFVHKVRGDLRQNGWGCGVGDENTCANAAGYNFDLGFYNRAIQGFACLGSVKVENSSTSADMQQNIENKNPNSRKPAFGLGTCSSGDVGLVNPKLAFGNVTKKRRVMKRKKRASNSGDCSFGSALNNSILSTDSAEDTKKQVKGTYPFNSFASSSHLYLAIGSASYSGPEISTNSKQDLDDYITEPPFDTGHKSNSSELAAYQSGNDHMPEDDAVAYGVDRWLEDRGFGKYVEMFEMHEVDEEALPMLTFEDLKEMGVDAIGPRRKLYKAIQQLRGTAVDHE